MQEYADQETQRLKAELEIVENYNDMLIRELTELKEKHKRDDEGYHEIRDFVSKFLKSYGGEGFQKSDIESEGYWYISKNGKDSINLGVFFEEIIEDWEDYYNETHKTK
jgi:hypothetical protein